MNYTSNEIQNMAFKKAIVGGYTEDSVRDVLLKIVEDYNFLVHENIELKDKIAILNEGIHRYKAIEDSLQSTLVVAQRTGEEIKRNSYEKAENIIKEAELRAQKCVEEANREVIKIRFEYEEMRKNLHIYKAKSETLILSQLEVLKHIFNENEC